MPSFFERLKAGLRRTREVLTGLLRGSLEELETALISADVGIKATEKIIGTIRNKPGDRTFALKQEVVTLLDTAGRKPLPVEDDSVRPRIIMIVGVNGSGKTSTVGKLARRYRQQGKSVIVAACDTYRDAAAPQLRIWAERSGVELVFSERGQDAAAVAFDAIAKARAQNTELVLVDTAGRLHTRRDLMDEAKKIKRVIGKTRAGAPDEIWIVLDATVGQNGIVQARTFNNELGLTGIIITKLDGTAKAGVVIPIVMELNLPVLYVGVGEDLDDLEEFSAQDFADALFGED